MAVKAVEHSVFVFGNGLVNASGPPEKHQSHDDRSPMAMAVEKASEVTTIAFMMVLPALLGYWLDLYLVTVPLCAIVGLVLGMTGGIWQLIKLVNRPPKTGDRLSSSPSSVKEDGDGEG